LADVVPLAGEVVPGPDLLPGEARVLASASRALSGERRGVRAVLPFLGPAFIAAVAYVDPGNFATNMAGGSQFGYTLLWVVLAANLMAMLVQALSAKLGIATGSSLPEVCRDRLPFPVVVLLWLQAEAVAMATDLAEFIGAALGLRLVSGLSL
jgi:manganese transport protein